MRLATRSTSCGGSIVRRDLFNKDDGPQRPSVPRPVRHDVVSKATTAVIDEVRDEARLNRGCDGKSETMQARDLCQSQGVTAGSGLRRVFGFA